MGKNFFKSKKNIITFSIAVALTIAIIVTVILLLCVKSPKPIKPEYVNGLVENYSVYYDKSGINKELTINSYTGDIQNRQLVVPDKFTIDGKDYVVTKIENKAFSAIVNEKLKNANKLILPETIVEIGDNAFEGTINLTNLHIKGTVEKFGKNLFQNSSIKNLTIDNLTAGYEFKTFVDVIFDKLIINNIVGNVEDFTQEFSNSIRAVELYLGEDVENATMLKQTIQKATTLSYHKDTVLFSPTFLSSSTIKTLYIKGIGTKLEASVVDNISTEAKSTIENIYLEESCNEIGPGVDFEGFTKLQSVYMYGKKFTISLDTLSKAPATAKLDFVDNEDFILTITSGEKDSIANKFMARFTDITSIKNIVILNNIKTIKYNAFSEVKNLKSISFKIDSDIETIEAGAFGSLKLDFYGPVESSHKIYESLVTSQTFKANVKTYNNEV